MTVTIYRRRIPEYPVAGMPLGRHVHFDSRSEAYPYIPAVPRELTSVLWQCHIPPLDQGQLGSCTGNDLVGNISTSPNFEQLPATHPALDENLAVKVYSGATSLDSFPGQYPPTDTGSDALDACKSAQQLGLIGSYLHATTLSAMQQAVMTGPFMFDVNWYDSFDTPGTNGFVSLTPGAQIRGGHSFMVLGMDANTGRFLAQNSWGSGWGYHGTFQFSFADADRLLSEEGAAIVPMMATIPAPTPTPTPTPPSPPQPSPEPPEADREAELAAIAVPWAMTKRYRTDLVELRNAINRWHNRIPGA